MEVKNRIMLDNGEYTVGDLKKFLNGIDDDAKIVLDETFEQITLLHFVEIQHIGEFLKIE